MRTETERSITKSFEWWLAPNRIWLRPWPHNKTWRPNPISRIRTQKTPIWQAPGPNESIVKGISSQVNRKFPGHGLPLCALNTIISDTNTSSTTSYIEHTDINKQTYKHRSDLENGNFYFIPNLPFLSWLNLDCVFSTSANHDFRTTREKEWDNHSPKHVLELLPILVTCSTFVTCSSVPLKCPPLFTSQEKLRWIKVPYQIQIYPVKEIQLETKWKHPKFSYPNSNSICFLRFQWACFEIPIKYYLNTWGLNQIFFGKSFSLQNMRGIRFDNLRPTEAKLMWKTCLWKMHLPLFHKALKLLEIFHTHEFPTCKTAIPNLP